MKLILASKSPRRLNLLRGAGLEIEVCPSHIDEQPIAGESPAALVKRLSREKALACKREDLPVVAADTVVVLNGSILGQPKDLHEAEAMLSRLSGRDHVVLTGVCVRFGEELAQTVVQTRVHFRKLRKNEIHSYLKHHQVLDKAGAYAVQEGAASFIVRIEGPLDNVIGLPLRETLDLLETLLKAGLKADMLTP